MDACSFSQLDSHDNLLILFPGIKDTEQKVIIKFKVHTIFYISEAWYKY